MHSRVLASAPEAPVARGPSVFEFVSMINSELNGIEELLRGAEALVHKIQYLAPRPGLPEKTPTKPVEPPSLVEMLSEQNHRIVEARLALLRICNHLETSL